MVLTRAPLMRSLILLWCLLGMYVANVDAFLFEQHYTEDVLQMAAEQSAVDTGIKTGTAEIRRPSLPAHSPSALRNPVTIVNRKAYRPPKLTAKPRRLSHIEYCPRKMVRSIMLQFHPHEGVFMS